MRDENKTLRPWLESWGAWRRLRLVIDYPTQAVSCNPELHIATPIVEPRFQMPRYDRKLTPADNAQRYIAHEKLLREFHHVRRTESKPKRVSSAPDYDPHWRMNAIDRAVQALSAGQREVIKLRYQNELKVNEIPSVICRSLDTVNKRLAAAHKNLRHLPTALLNPKTYSFYSENCNSCAVG